MAVPECQKILFIPDLFKEKAMGKKIQSKRQVQRLIQNSRGESFRPLCFLPEPAGEGQVPVHLPGKEGQRGHPAKNIPGKEGQRGHPALGQAMPLVVAPPIVTGGPNSLV